MKLFVLCPHGCLKFCTGGSSESIQKRELYFNNVCASRSFQVYICITVTDLPPDALTVDFVATPKQIRELMNVDGLTNDEVNRHLQADEVANDEVKSHLHIDGFHSGHTIYSLVLLKVHFNI
ncbi:hypothetical protein AMTRI_Chr06g174510 [Amborella trichopoda]